MVAETNTTFLVLTGILSLGLLALFLTLLWARVDRLRARTALLLAWRVRRARSSTRPANERETETRAKPVDRSARFSRR